MSPLKIKTPSKNLGKQRCEERFNSGVKGLNVYTYSAPVSTGNTFQDLPRLRETADNTERYT
jgi:hypothetical protein